MQYKGYAAQVGFDDDNNVFYGRVLGIRDVIAFEGGSVEQLRREFQEAIDDYLEFCKDLNQPPEKPFSGKFILRLSPDLHRRAATEAGQAGLSLNAWVSEQLESRLSEQKPQPDSVRRSKSSAATTSAATRGRASSVQSADSKRHSSRTKAGVNPKAPRQ